MAAEAVNLKPRQRPPKPSDAQNQKAMIEAIAAQSAAMGPAAPPIDVLPGNFKDINEEFHGQPSGTLTQEELTARALGNLPEGAPVAPVTQSQSNPDLKETVVLAPQTPPPPKPPSTMAEFRQQHQAANTRYPDVNEIFQGKIPNEIPLNGPIEIPKPVEQPVMRVEHVITHELPNTAMAYIALKTFDAYVGSSFCHFDKDQMIVDTSVIDELLRTGCVNIAPYQDAADFIQCPHCSNHFPDPRGVVKYS